MDKKQITNSIVILVFLILTSGAAFYFWNKSASEQNKLAIINQQNTERLNQLLIEQQAVIAKITDEEAKIFFKSTEVISNNLPDSIEFWSEANCPNEGTDYDYLFPNFNLPEAYVVTLCKKGNIGSHGGCKTCGMSQIKLDRLLFKEITNDRNQIPPEKVELGKNKNLLVNFYKNEDNEVLLINILEGNKFLQNIITNPSLEYTPDARDNIFTEDFNFDGYKDLKIYNGNGNSYGWYYIVYLFNPVKNKFILSPELFNLGSYILNKDKKQIDQSFSNGLGGAEWTQRIYQAINGKIILIEERNQIFNANTKKCNLTTKILINNTWTTKEEAVKCFGDE